MRLVLPGQEVSFNEPNRRFHRHHHLRPYAALVVRGWCEEVGDRGRFRAEPGDVLLHRAFDGHSDRIGRSGAVFINFPVDKIPEAPRGTVADIDSIVRAYEHDRIEASEMFREQLQPCSGDGTDWPDLLAHDLATQCESISEWAERHRLHPASVSRGFALAYGISPKRFRLEQRASAAARALALSDLSATKVAADTGFADQAHMTRAMRQLFGLTPGRLRRLS